MIEVLYFGWVRELIGADSESVAAEAPLTMAAEAPLTMAALVAALAGRSPAHAEALGVRERLRFALNQAIVDGEAEVRAGDEVAIFPPVTGG